MSLVYITHHNENIYNIAKVHKKAVITHIDYVSKFNKAIRKEIKKKDIVLDEDGVRIITNTERFAHRTMGPRQLKLHKACDYQRPVNIRWRRLKDHVCPKPLHPAPPVPRYRPAEEEKVELPKKDYIAINIERIQSIKPKIHMPKFVDTNVGTTHNLVDSGLLPQYICTKKFGKVPEYLQDFKETLVSYLPVCEEKKAKIVDPGRRPLTSEERSSLLKGLKDRHKLTLKAFMCSSVYTDTPGKKKRANMLERELRQLESDIELFESKKCLYVETD